MPSPPSLDGLLVGIVAGIAATIHDDDPAERAAALLVLADGSTVARRRDHRRGQHDLAAGTRPVSVAA